MVVTREQLKWSSKTGEPVSKIFVSGRFDINDLLTGLLGPY